MDILRRQLLENQLETDIIEWVKDYNSLQDRIKNDVLSDNDLINIIESANQLVEKFATYLQNQSL